MAVTSTWHLEDGSYLRLQNVTLGIYFASESDTSFLCGEVESLCLRTEPLTSDSTTVDTIRKFKCTSEQFFRQVKITEHIPWRKPSCLD